jgi:hypothetical protein
MKNLNDAKFFLKNTREKKEQEETRKKKKIKIKGNPASENVNIWVILF